MFDTNELFDFGPNIIGATGGSGTRVFARLVRHGGMFIGTHLNASEDAIEFGEYSDRWINTHRAYGKSWRPSTTRTEMLRDLEGILERHCAPLSEGIRPWGWKEPRSIYLLPFFHSQFPRLKFLHVVRDGRDMAYSANQNQLHKHGRALLGWRDRRRGPPLQSIALWSRINLMAADYGQKHLGGQYLRVRFEDLCADPAPTILRVFEFFGLQGDAQKIAELELSPPATLGRWRREPSFAEVSKIGRRALRQFGYVG